MDNCHPGLDLAGLAAKLHDSAGIAAKTDVAVIAARLGLSGRSAVPAGDDCAAIADGNGYLLLAIEGFINEFVASEPWFAGWCAVMVNVSDIAAMGGRAIAVVDALWADGAAKAAPLLAGLRAASEAYGVPIVGGHSNLRCDHSQLSMAILGRAENLLTSFAARPGERLIAAVDLRGEYRPYFSNWDAATQAPPARLRGDLEILPALAQADQVRAAKDISQAGIVGTAIMLAECSGVEIVIDMAAVPRPPAVAMERWLNSFPSFGFLLTAAPEDAETVIGCFAARGIAAADIGAVRAGSRVMIAAAQEIATVWDYAKQPLLGCGRV